MVRRLTTEELIGASFHEIAIRKPIDKITVKEIADNCGVSSTTFYNHFRDKYALIGWMYDHQIDAVFAEFMDGRITWEDVLRDFVTILNNDRVFYQNLHRHSNGDTSPFSPVNPHSIELLQQAIRMQDPEVGEETLFDATLYLRGVSCCITEWFAHGEPDEAGRLVRWMYNAVPDRLKPFLWGAQGQRDGR